MKVSSFSHVFLAGALLLPCAVPARAAWEGKCLTLYQDQVNYGGTYHGASSTYDGGSHACPPYGASWAQSTLVPGYPESTSVCIVSNFAAGYCQNCCTTNHYVYVTGSAKISYSACNGGAYGGVYRAPCAFCTITSTSNTCPNASCGTPGYNPKTFAGLCSGPSGHSFCTCAPTCSACYCNMGFTVPCPSHPCRATPCPCHPCMPLKVKAHQPIIWKVRLVQLPCTIKFSANAFTSAANNYGGKGNAYAWSGVGFGAMTP